MTGQHKVYNVQDVIDFLTTGDISDLSHLWDDDSDKDMPYIQPAISDNFDDDNNEFDKSTDETWEPKQSHHNSIDDDNNESLIIPKVCDKIETQAVKKMVFIGEKKILLFLRSTMKKHLQTNQLKLIHHTSNLNSVLLMICWDWLLIIQTYIAPKNLVKTSILLVMKCRYLLECIHDGIGKTTYLLRLLVQCNALPSYCQQHA